MEQDEAQIEEESQIFKAIVEDALECEGCLKADVCVVLHMLTQQHMGVKLFIEELKSKYKVGRKRWG